jgi:starch synthase
MFVVMASPEVAPLARTGGLGDVLGALPRALHRRGVQVAIVMPCYDGVYQSHLPFEDLEWIIEVPVSTWTEHAGVRHVQLADEVSLYAIRHDRYFARPGVYGLGGGAYPDNAERFTFFSRAVLAVLEHIGVPDVVHSHDWTAALVPAFLRADAARYPHLASLRTVLTIHNLGYQGDFWPIDWHLLNLDGRYFQFDALEAWGRINFLKGGISFADAITTVSPTYAREIQTVEMGHGLDAALRFRSEVLSGILNGADYEEWDPRHDAYITTRFSPENPAGKAICKAALQREVGLPVDPRPALCGVVSRLAGQKGIDLLAGIMPQLSQRDVQLVVLGRGEALYEELLRDLAQRYPQRMVVRLDFDNALAHRIEAGCDLFLMPSRYEPCGLNQMYSMRYGTIPVVRATGGLEDSVIDADAAAAGTGFKFLPYSGSALLDCIDRALCWRADRQRWSALMQRAMRVDFSWDRAAGEYVQLYERLLASPPYLGPAR